MSNSILKSFLLEYIDYIVPLFILYYIVSFFINRRKKSFTNTPKCEEGEHTEECVSKDYTFKIQGNREENCTCTPFLECKEGVPFDPHPVKLDGGIDKFLDMMRSRRSVRHYNSAKTVPYETIEKCLLAAGTSPSGVHTQPWTFCVVSDPEVKRKIRDIIEGEEYLNYMKRMPCQWITDLKPLKTNYVKSYLTDAPFVIVVFKQAHSIRDNGQRKHHYYNEISVAVACGILLSSFQAAGLNSILTRPACCGPPLRALLNRPESEKLVFVVPVGYATDDCRVPDLKRKTAAETIVRY